MDKLSPTKIGIQERRAAAEQLAELFKCLADPTRLRILTALKEHGSLCVHELCTWLGMSQPAVSHQLRILRGARLVAGRRAGREIHYSIDDDHVLAVLSEGLTHVRHGGR
jgi:ArsR family transcriptional regulator, lead/cadmium/zinc/bismuth-responsive transcriptional repressor